LNIKATLKHFHYNQVKDAQTCDLHLMKTAY